MTAIAPVVIKDGTATPADHTFAPVNIDAAGVAKWADRSGGISVGFPTLTFSLKNPSQGSKNYKLTAKVALPILEQTSPSTSTGIQPAPTVAYTMLANVEMVLPERSTVLDRKNLIAYLKNYLANATVIQAAVENYEAVY